MREIRYNNMVVRLDDCPDFLTAAEARLLLRLSKNAIYQALREGVVPHIRVGRKVLVPKQGIIDLMENAGAR